MEWKTTEIKFGFHFKGIMFNMNDFLFIRMFIKLHYYILFNFYSIFSTTSFGQIPFQKSD